MEQDRHEKLRSEFHRIFQSDGLSEVDLRDRVLDAFLAMDHHVGAQELADRLSEQGETISGSKVKRFLDLFAAYGIARRQVFQGVGEVYEHHHLGTHHDHMVCVQCGIIVEFESPEMEFLQETVAKRHGFRTAHHQMVIYGVCPSCDEGRSAGFPLAHTSPGEVVKVQSVRGKVEHVRRMEDMGLHRNSVVEVMRNDGGGPIIVASGDTRLGIDRKMAGRVLVVPSRPDAPDAEDDRRHRLRRHGGGTRSN